MNIKIESKDADGPLIAAGSAEGIAQPFKGYVEAYGYHTLASGWFFTGWVSLRADLRECFQTAVAEFIRETVAGDALVLFFPREDLKSEGGVGFLLFLAAETRTTALFRQLRVSVGDDIVSIVPVTEALHLPEIKLIPQVNYTVSLVAPGPEQAAVAQLISGSAATSGHGFVEYFGYHVGSAGWYLSGWVSHPWPEGVAPERFVASFAEGDIRGGVVAVLYARAELPPGAMGVIFYLKGPMAAMGQLVALNLLAAGTRLALEPLGGLLPLREAELSARVRSNLTQAKPGLFRDRMSNLLNRRAYVGEDSLDVLSPAIFLHVDEAIRCGADGLLLMGWMLAKPGDISEIRLCCDSQVRIVRPTDFVKIERPDVLTEFAKHGFDDVACGFIAYLPVTVEPHSRLYFEVETQRFEVGYRNIARPARAGMAAIKHLLGVVDVRFEEMREAFERVLGPAVDALNRERLAVPVGFQTVDYGVAPKNPRFSVIVPLHGRLDFVEYQLALFSARAEYAEVEFIYVLDDPPKRREAQNLFTSIYERFLIPFRAVLLDRNVGFAPANNVGLRQARGEYIAYLNSDVFPGTQDWLEQLADRLETDSQLGVVGPLLLFEDGSVQHRGMYFERLAEFGNWYFCQHLDKGLRYTGGNELQQYISITGACMLLRRELALQIGGFDEIYAIGDFEDSDMCLKLQALGYGCAVDPQVQLYHLERKSQISAAMNWRMNLTAYNAWQHERRWSATIAKKQEFAVEGRL